MFWFYVLGVKRGTTATTILLLLLLLASGVFAVPVKSPLGDFGDFGGGGGGGADNVQLNHIPKKAFRSGKPKSSPKP